MSNFQIILSGQCLAGFDPAKVRPALAKLVGQTEAVVAQLLAGHEVVVKSNVDIVTGTRYLERLHAIGVAARIAPEVLQLDGDLAERLSVKSSIAGVVPERTSGTNATQSTRLVAPSQKASSTSKQTNAFRNVVLLGMTMAVAAGGYAALTSSGRATKVVSTPASISSPAREAAISTPALAPAPAQEVPAHGIHNPYAGISRRGADTINLDGEITRAMATEFDLTIRELRAELGFNGLIEIDLNSKGGDLAAAMNIGHSIRNDGNNVVTVWDDKVCFSSCVFILAGGEQRDRRGMIGIHRPYLTEPTSDGAALRRWYERLSTDAKTYLREMNVRESLFDDMVSIPPEQIHIFQSAQEMDRYGLLDWDPVAEEQLSAAQMQRFGIANKSLLYERKQQLERECINRVPANQFEACYERVMRGG